VILWFVGPAVLIVWSVFRSPTADYRMVALGALVPLLEVPIGEPRLLHALLGPTVVMVAVMLGARGRRLVQRRLLGIPIGMFLHLVLDGAWADARGFWWPALGTSWSTEQLPVLGRGLALNVVLELVGLACCAWAWRRFRLTDPALRSTFWRTGRIHRSIVPGG
jgi:hypothetical protein